MKKLICILATAALFGACEQKTTNVTPAAPEKKTENNTTIVKPADTSKTETKTTTTTSSSPNP